MNKPDTPLTQGQMVRLECIRLAYRHDRDAGLNIEKARELEQYVMQEKPAEKPRTRSTSPGKA